MRDARMARQATSVWALVLAPPIIAGLLVLGSFNADSRAAPLGPQLAVTQLRVAPTILRSGGKVRVTALITNRGDEPARNLQLGVAVARGTAAPVTRDGARVRWAPVEMTP